MVRRVLGAPSRVCWSPRAGGAPAPQADGEVYPGYQRPEPIGKIVREDCSRSQTKCDGRNFEGSVGAMGVGASANYKESAVREADALVAPLKEQRGPICNNFNTCKLTVGESRDDQRRPDDSFVALMALRGEMASIDAAGAERLIEQVCWLRAGTNAVAGPPAASAPPPAFDAKWRARRASLVARRARRTLGGMRRPRARVRLGPAGGPSPAHAPVLRAR